MGLSFLHQMGDVRTGAHFHNPPQREARDDGHAVTDGSQTAMQQPIFGLGATGFAPAQRHAIESMLAQLPPQGLRWRLVPFAEADAWWVNGHRIQLLADGNLRVAAGLPTERSLNLHLAEIDRPIAFAAPIAVPDFEPRCQFDLADEEGAHACLRQFETWLHVLHAQFILGALVMRRGASLRGTVHHVSHKGNLLALLDYRLGHVALHPTVDPSELWNAEWEKRPAAACDAPAGFIECTPAQLLWAYVCRTERELLPPRYRTNIVYFRHVPRVPLRWMRDSQLKVLRELHAEAGTFDELRTRTGLPEAVLERDLACMYYTGGITTTASKAAQQAWDGEAIASTPSEPFDAGNSETHPPGLQRPRDLTVPALLEHRLRPDGLN